MAINSNLKFDMQHPDYYRIDFYKAGKYNNIDDDGTFLVFKSLNKNSDSYRSI